MTVLVTRVIIPLLLVQLSLPSLGWAVDCSKVAPTTDYKDCGRIKNTLIRNTLFVGNSMQKFSLDSMLIKSVSFTGVNMQDSKIRGSKIVDSVFENANLENVVFMGVRFENVDFTGSNLKNARFVRCFFRDVDLQKTNISPEQLEDPILISSKLPSLHRPAQK